METGMIRKIHSCLLQKRKAKPRQTLMQISAHPNTSQNRNPSQIPQKKTSIPPLQKLRAPIPMQALGENPGSKSVVPKNPSEKYIPKRLKKSPRVKRRRSIRLRNKKKHFTGSLPWNLGRRRRRRKSWP